MAFWELFLTRTIYFRPPGVRTDIAGKLLAPLAVYRKRKKYHHQSSSSHLLIFGCVIFGAHINNFSRPNRTNTVKYATGLRPSVVCDVLCIVAKRLRPRVNDDGKL